MTDFHTSLDAALNGEPRWPAVNPLLPGDESDYCPVCGCRLRDNRLSELKVCPFGPHSDQEESALSNETMHHYDSGVYHDTYPGEAISCCDKPPGDPIHLPPRPPARICNCDRVLQGRPHYWTRVFGCPE